MDNEKAKPAPNSDQEPLSCDSCGWVIKQETEIYAEKNGEITCEHCLESLVERKELH